MQCRPPWASLALYSTPSPQRARGQGERTRTPVITMQASEKRFGRRERRMMGRCAWVVTICLCLGLGGGGVTGWVWDVLSPINCLLLSRFHLLLVTFIVSIHPPD